MSEKQPPSKRRRAGGPLFTAMFIALAVVAWLASPLLTDPQGAPTRPSAGAADTARLVPKVRIRLSEAQMKSARTVIRGRTEADRKVIVRAETGGTVREVAEKGAEVKEGELLCRISIDARKAQRKEAEAFVSQRLLELEGAESLARQGHRSAMSLAASRAGYDSALARLEQIKLDINNTRIAAPFAGRLEDVHVYIGDLLAPGQPCATVIDMDPMLITGEATEDEVQHINFGAEASVMVESNIRTKGKVSYVSAAADERTRSFRMEVEVPNSNRALNREGVTAEVEILAPPIPAHRIPLAVLTLNDNGQIGVRVVEGGNIVRFRPVQIIDSASGAAWVSGLADTINLITVGQEFVADGTKVEATYDKEAGVQ